MLQSSDENDVGCVSGMEWDVIIRSMGCVDMVHGCEYDKFGGEGQVGCARLFGVFQSVADVLRSLVVQHL